MTAPPLARVRALASRALRRLALVAGLTMGVAAAAPTLPAQEGADGPSPPSPSLEVYVLTFGQGDYVWERFGHNALWLHDPATGEDVAYHWGLFDFQQPNFVGRFLTGDTRYWMEGFDAASLLDAYRRYDRTIVAQRLRLTPAQAAELRRFLAWNARDENKFYRYDYYRDNCSTRLRDAIDRALGGALRAALEPVRTPFTHRSESVRLVDGMPFTQAGMHVALGHPADRPMTAWEEAFVPMRLRDRLRAVRTADGASLVADERTLYESRRAPEAASAPSMLPRFLLAGLCVAAVLAALGLAAPRARGARVALGMVGALWGLVPGLVGVALLLAWGFTRHDFWDRNENVLQLGPQSLPLLLLVPLAVSRPAWRGRARAWALVVAGISALGLVLHVLPGFDQPNLDVVAFALPVHAALAWGLARLDAVAG